MQCPFDHHCSRCASCIDSRHHLVVIWSCLLLPYLPLCSICYRGGGRGEGGGGGAGGAAAAAAPRMMASTDMMTTIMIRKVMVMMAMAVMARRLYPWPPFCFANPIVIYLSRDSYGDENLGSDGDNNTDDEYCRVSYVYSHSLELWCSVFRNRVVREKTMPTVGMGDWNISGYV